jgi:GNAT superfamily N-acetyltransferase
MAASTIVVREPRAADEAAWRALWNGYLRFYESVLPEETTHHTWERLLDPDSGLFGRVAVRDGRVVGFAHCTLHQGSWERSPICYLEDLFVDPGLRRSGAGRALIEHLIALGKERGWSRLYWHTRQGNATARSLYDRLASVDDFVKYTVDLG